MNAPSLPTYFASHAPMALGTRSSWVGYVAPLGLAVALALAPAPIRAGTVADGHPVSGAAGEVTTADPADAPLATDPERFPERPAVRALIKKETARTGLPADIAEAVVFVESRYNSSVIGRVGEIGLMQVRPGTAAMLGFKGSTAELARPEVNIHYGVRYLARAWRLARGDLCKALMKYRAGHGEEVMTARSVIYCNRARHRLIAMNSPFARPSAFAATASETALASATASKSPLAKTPSRPTDVYAIYRHGTAAASRAFWALHEARIRAIKARVEAKWRRVAFR